MAMAAQSQKVRPVRKAQFLVVALFSVSVQTVMLYRVAHYLIQYRYLRWLVIPITYCQNVLSGCYISPKAEIGGGFRLPHPVGIVIGDHVVIGNRVTVYQNVTLGSHGRRGQRRDYPIIEDGVVLYANSVVVGGVCVGRGSIVGANSVVTKDVPEYCVVAGAPAKPTGNRTVPQSGINGSCHDSEPAQPSPGEVGHSGQSDPVL